MTFTQENSAMPMKLDEIIAALATAQAAIETTKDVVTQNSAKNDLELTMIQAMRTDMAALQAQIQTLQEQGNATPAQLADLAARAQSLQTSTGELDTLARMDASKEDTILNTLGTPLTPTT